LRVFVAPADLKAAEIFADCLLEEDSIDAAADLLFDEAVGERSISPALLSDLLVAMRSYP
jgi:hypothetical protein